MIILKYVIFEDEIVFSVSEDELLEDKIVFFEFIELLQFVIIRDGERIELRVRFRGFFVFRIRWYYEGKEIMNSVDFQIIIDFSRGESIFVIVEVFLEDQGEYICIVKNKYGEIIIICRFNVVCKYLFCLEIEILLQNLLNISLLVFFFYFIQILYF